jgi:hypothetical protein
VRARQREPSYRVNSPRLDSPLLVEGKLTPQNQNLSGRRPPLAEDESGQHDQIGQQPQNNLKSHNHGLMMPHRLYPEHQLSRSNKCGPQGKRGDFIVLDRNIFAIDPFYLHDTRVMATYLDGREVYAAKAK